jgi:hypothetical protein
MLLDKNEAEQLTTALKLNTKDFARLLKKAWEGKIWIALGYPTMNEWLKECVGLSRSRGYQLIAIATVEERLQEAVTLHVEFRISDMATRLITAYGLEKFVGEVAADATSDPLRNEQIVCAHVEALRVQSVSTVEAVMGNSDTVSSVTPVEDVGVSSHAERNGSRHVLVTMKALRRQADCLPTTDEVNDVAVITALRVALKDAISHAESTLTKYEAAFPQNGARK